MSSPSYLMASLPMIELGDVPPLTMEEFRHRCIGMLEESSSPLWMLSLQAKNVTTSSWPLTRHTKYR